MRESRSHGEGAQLLRTEIKIVQGGIPHMKPTMEILAKISMNSKKHQDEVFILFSI